MPVTSALTLDIREFEDKENTCLVAALLINGVRFGDDCIDLAELKRSALGSGAYDLQTCGCGIPDDAGFWEPIFVQHVGDEIVWEFDGRFHPVPIKDEAVETQVVRCRFDRKQYISEIRTKFLWLRTHSKRATFGPCGFSASIFDEDFPESDSPQTPFPKGASIVVGYTGDFRQPWIWVEDAPDVYPKSLMPSGYLWGKFEYWSSMWVGGGEHGLCVYNKAGEFQLQKNVSVQRCNTVVEELASGIRDIWGRKTRVLFDRIRESCASVSDRVEL